MTSLYLLDLPLKSQLYDYVVSLCNSYNIEVFFGDYDISKCDGIIALLDNAQKLQDILRHNKPCFAYLNSYGNTNISKNSQISFNNENDLPTCLKGKSFILDHNVRHIKSNQLNSQFKHLCCLDHGIFWAKHIDSQRQIHISPHPDFDICGKDKTGHVFPSESSFYLIPILSYIRSILKEDDWIQPPIFANFMFDDPNLHSLQYGFIKYRDVINSALKHSYHASIATIPLDLWYVNKAVANLFRDYHNQISLLIHGNNHLRREFGANRTHEEAISLLLQAMKRVEKAQNKYGIDISRVVAPPHGACNELHLMAMSEVEIEGCCVSSGSLRNSNPYSLNCRALGIRSIDMLCNTPVVNRYRLTKNNINKIMFSHFLGQPIVMVGHHEDLKYGLSDIENIADYINTLEKISWKSMKNIYRGQYSHKITNDTLIIRMHSNHIEVNIPPGTKCICVIPPLKYNSCTLNMGINRGHSTEWISVVPNSYIPISRCDTLSFTYKPLSIKTINPPRPRLYLSSYIRRLYTEVRDRLYPSYAAILE